MSEPHYDANLPSVSLVLMFLSAHAALDAVSAPHESGTSGKR